MKQTMNASATVTKRRCLSCGTEYEGNSMSPRAASSCSRCGEHAISALDSGVHLRRDLATPKERISVLVVTADSMTSELLKNAFAHGRKGFTVETLTGTSQKIIDELDAHKADVTLISEELQDGPEAGIKVLQKTREARNTSAIMLLQSSKPDRVVNAFRDGARGVFLPKSFLEIPFEMHPNGPQGANLGRERGYRASLERSNPNQTAASE